MFVQRGRDGVEDVAHGGVLDRVVRARVVLVDGLQPAHVVVRVRHDVHRERRGGERAAEGAEGDGGAERQRRHYFI